MRVRFFGVRGSYPCPGPANARYGANTAAVSIDPDLPILLDLGTGITRVPPAARGRPAHYDALEHQGRSVAYLSDHQAPSGLDSAPDAVLELCDGADLLIHDAQYPDEEFEAKSEWGYSTVGYAVYVAREAGARRLCLFHHDPSHDDDEIDRLLAYAHTLVAGASCEVLAAFEGLDLLL